MKKIKIIIICLLVFSLSFSNCFANTLDKLNNETQNIKNKLEKNNSTMQGIDKEVNNLKLEILNLDSQINSQNAELENINKKVEEVEKQLNENKAKINKVTSTQNGSEELLQARLRAIYENGITNEWEMMFNSNGFMDYLAKKRIITTITEYDRNLADSMKVEKEYHNNLKKEVEAQKSQLDQLLYDREKTAKTLEMAKQNKENKSNKLSSDKKYLEVANSQLKKEQDAINKKIEEEIIRLQSISGNIVSEKGFLWPFPASGKITCHFGGYDGHTGMDISARVADRTLVAAKSGKVIKTVTGRGNTYPWSYDYGNYVVIDHGNGQSTRYAHLDSVNVSVGQFVRQGQKIGMAGNTGYSTGPHLHFEVRINGKAKDPRNYVRFK